MALRRISLEDAVALYLSGAEVRYSYKDCSAVGTQPIYENWAVSEYSKELQKKLRDYRFYTEVE